MATRATYQIGDSTFYCHWDGYPRGAAVRFINMINAKVSFDEKSITGIKEVRGGYPFAFIRGNLDAEPTDSHDAHGDTEYRYTLSIHAKGTVLVSVDMYNRVSEDWEVYCTNVDLAEFIRKERDEFARFCIKNRNDPKFKNLPKTERAIAEALDAELPLVVKAFVDGRVQYATFDTANNIANVNVKLADNQVGSTKTHYLAIAKAWVDAMSIASELDEEDHKLRPAA